MPRVTPVMPPILEAKSNQVIFSDLENSLRKREGIKSFARKNYQMLWFVQKRCSPQRYPVHRHCRQDPPEGVEKRKEKKNTSEREERISLLRMIGFLYSFLVGEGSPLM